MSAEVYGITTFCEDIRPERDGQVTFVGAFTTGLRVTELPTTLAKLGLFISIVVPRSETIGKLITKVYFPGDALSDPSWVSEVDIGEVIERRPLLTESRAAFQDPDIDMPHKLDQNVIFSPVTIKAEGFIKVRVEVGGHLVKAGTLKVECVESEHPADGETIAIKVTQNRL